MRLGRTLPAVDLLGYAEVAEPVDRFDAEMIHDRRDLLHALGAQQPDLGQIVVAIAVGGINFVEGVHQRPILPFQFGGILGNPHGGAGCVLVTGVGPREVAVAFLAPEDEIRPAAGGFQLVHLLGDVFEADQQVADAGYVVGTRHRIDQSGGDVRLDDDPLRGQASGGPQPVDGVIRQDDGDLVTGQEKPLPAVVHHDADAVRVRVGAEQDVGSGLLRQRQRRVEGFDDFRVGDVESHFFESPAQVGGRRAKRHIEAQALQHRIDRGDAGAVQGGIKDLQAAI